MSLWNITVLYYGKISLDKSIMTPGLDKGKVLDYPYLGFLLQNGKENVVIDTGIHEDTIVDGKAWGGNFAEGGSSYVIEALGRAGLEIGDIDTVLYTHLHNDHAGCANLFPKARTFFQKDELTNLLNPLPSQEMRRDYDTRTPGDLKKIENLFLLDGDLTLPNGLAIYKIPGHTLGSMAIVADTENGKRIITGDMPHTITTLFPKQDRMVLMNGEEISITPAPDVYGPFIINGIVYDHYGAYSSLYKLKALAPEFKAEYYLCGHDPHLVFQE